MVYPLLPAFVTGVLGAGPPARGPLAGAAGVAAAGGKVGAVRDGERRGRMGNDGESVAAPSPFSPVLPRPSPSLPLLAISFFYLLRMPETLLILRSQQLGVSTAAVLLLWAALHVVRSSVSFVGGRLTNRIGAGRPPWLGWP